MRIPLAALTFVTLVQVTLVQITLFMGGAAKAEHLEYDRDTRGELRCNIAGGFGFIVGGQRAITCVYYRRDGRVEFYIGSYSRYGVDVGPSQARQAIFEVSARPPEPIGKLDGDFVGVGAGTSLGRGESGDALIGGRGDRVLIFPIANSRMTGLNFALGISRLHLRYRGTEGRRERDRYTLPEGLD